MKKSQEHKGGDNTQATGPTAEQARLFRLQQRGMGEGPDAKAAREEANRRMAPAGVRSRGRNYSRTLPVPR